MLRGLLIWNTLLSLLVGYLLMKRHDIPEKKTEKTNVTSSNCLKNNDPFKMVYFEMDSVASHFELVKEVKAELSKKEEEIDRQIEILTQSLQQKYKYYQNQAESGSLTQAQKDAAMADIKKMDDEIKNRKQQLEQEYKNLLTRKEVEIKSKIETFLKEYTKTKNFSYIFSYDPNLFYYVDTSLNITADVVKGLNEMYRPVRKN